MCLAVTTRKWWSYLALFSLIVCIFYLQISNCYLISKTMPLFETLNIYQSSSSIGPSSPRGSTSTTSIFPNMNELVAVWKKLVKNRSVLEVNFSQTIFFDTHYKRFLVQCNHDLVVIKSSYLVALCDIVVTVFLKTKSVTKSRVHCIYNLPNFYYN